MKLVFDKVWKAMLLVYAQLFDGKLFTSRCIKAPAIHAYAYFNRAEANEWLYLVSLPFAQITSHHRLMHLRDPEVSDLSLEAGDTFPQSCAGPYSLQISTTRHLAELQR